MEEEELEFLRSVAEVITARERDKFCDALQKIAQIADNACKDRDPGAPLGIEHEVYDLARSALNVHPDFLLPPRG